MEYYVNITKPRDPYSQMPGEQTTIDPQGQGPKEGSGYYIM